MHINKLPKYFLFVEKYNKNIFKNNIANLGIIYRNYLKKKNLNDVYRLRYECNKKNFQLFISNNLKLAIKSKADGLYIPAFNKTSKYFNSIGNKKFKIIGSAHNVMEIKEKIDQGCEAIFISPLFKVKKKKQFLNINRFNLLTIRYKKKIIALGGIRIQNINMLKMLNIYGMAGVTYLKKNRPKNIGRFL